MNKSTLPDWLPEQQDGATAYVARSGLPAVSRENKTQRQIINPFSVLTKLFPSRWLDIGFVLFCVYLWTSTPSRSINTHKRNTANIQLS